ncbi:hypothetical protein M885DRAFT_578732 [Pelagophyceae sp. CCMP2097]|nr:hypothetical protein M885DRAFT_578732 [Pelagophyceae sp. CCMP2097]
MRRRRAAVLLCAAAAASAAAASPYATEEYGVVDGAVEHYDVAYIGIPSYEWYHRSTIDALRLAVDTVNTRRRPKGVRIGGVQKYLRLTARSTAGFNASDEDQQAQCVNLAYETVQAGLLRGSGAAQVVFSAPADFLARLTTPIISAAGLVTLATQVSAPDIFEDNNRTYAGLSSAVPRINASGVDGVSFMDEDKYALDGSLAATKDLLFAELFYALRAKDLDVGMILNEAAEDTATWSNYAQRVGENLKAGPSDNLYIVSTPQWLPEMETKDPLTGWTSAEYSENYGTIFKYGPDYHSAVAHTNVALLVHALEHPSTQSGSAFEIDAFFRGIALRNETIPGLLNSTLDSATGQQTSPYMTSQLQYAVVSTIRPTAAPTAAPTTANGTSRDCQGCISSGAAAGTKHVFGADFSFPVPPWAQRRCVDDGQCLNGGLCGRAGDCICAVPEGGVASVGTGASASVLRAVARCGLVCGLGFYRDTRAACLPSPPGSYQPVPENVGDFETVKVYQCNDIFDCPGGDQRGTTKCPHGGAAARGLFTAFLYINLFAAFTFINDVIRASYPVLDTVLLTYQDIGIIADLNFEWPKSLGPFFIVFRVALFDVDIITPACSY